MSNIVDINDLRKQFQEKISVEDWKQFAEAQQTMLEKFQNELKLLRDKNVFLEKSLMRKSESLIFELSPEEKTCIEQIDRLSKISTERQLTLEEVKRLDLLIKNLKLVREESTIVVNNKRSENIKEVDLVAIAKSESDNT